jgi:D-glycero-alpha-D-manno-heptose-7-phosphate kinase
MIKYGLKHIMSGVEAIQKIIENEKIAASAPCRIDLGGTLDIATFHYPLSCLNPCTFNIAIDLRTTVQILPHRKGFIKISSRGFEDADFPSDQLPYKHPVGLMFAIASYFNIDGIHIHIHSTSPPRSALGGSSSAAIALIGAYNRIFKKLDLEEVSLDRIPFLAHAIEEGVAGVPCGIQDQLAAVYGGINAWIWKGKAAPQMYVRHIVAEPSSYPDIEKRMLVAYCGIPHESVNVNSQWVKQFLSGYSRSHWNEIISCTNAFVEAFARSDINAAVRMMNRETMIRLEMTPDVLDITGKRLFDQAKEYHCGARFTGAGAGGCLWALGVENNISNLRTRWKETLSEIPDACLLDVRIDPLGLLYNL